LTEETRLPCYDRSKKSAPRLTPKPPSSPRVIRATPQKPTARPDQPLRPRCSPSNTTASSEVNRGIEATIRLAAPALTVSCP
jgi:hypothetical protein